MYQGGLTQRWFAICKKRVIKTYWKKAHFVSILYLEAKMFKIENYILNYACFKHPWVLEVMPMPVETTKKNSCDYGHLAVFFLLFQSSYF